MVTLNNFRKLLIHIEQVLKMTTHLGALNKPDGGRLIGYHCIYIHKMPDYLCFVDWIIINDPCQYPPQHARTRSRLSTHQVVGAYPVAHFLG